MMIITCILAYASHIASLPSWGPIGSDRLLLHRWPGVSQWDICGNEYNANTVTRVMIIVTILLLLTSYIYLYKYIYINIYIYLYLYIYSYNYIYIFYK